MIRIEDSEGTHQLQISGNEYQVDAAGAHLIYQQEDVYYVSANKEQMFLMKRDVTLLSRFLIVFSLFKLLCNVNLNNKYFTQLSN